MLQIQQTPLPIIMIIIKEKKNKINKFLPYYTYLIIYLS